MATARPLARRRPQNGNDLQTSRTSSSAGRAPRGSSSEPRAQGVTVEIPVETRVSMRVHLRLATVRNILMRESRRAASRWGLTLPQFDVLAELARSDDEGFTFVQISRLLLVTSGNLTGIVDRLEVDGLVRRQADSRDRRVIRVCLTEKGRNLVERMLPQHALEVHALLSFMPEAKLELLNDALDELRSGLRDTIGSRSETGGKRRSDSTHRRV